MENLILVKRVSVTKMKVERNKVASIYTIAVVTGLICALIGSFIVGFDYGMHKTYAR